MASQRLLEQELFVRNLCVRAVPKTLNPKLVWGFTSHEPPSKDPKHKKPPQHPLKRARFQADEDLGFPELEIRWNPELLVRDFFGGV